MITIVLLNKLGLRVVVTVVKKEIFWFIIHVDELQCNTALLDACQFLQARVPVKGVLGDFERLFHNLLVEVSDFFDFFVRWGSALLINRLFNLLDFENFLL